MEGQDKRPHPFHVMAKPAGPRCNLACQYCFYLEKEQLFPEAPLAAMSAGVLESYIRQYIESQEAPEVTFAWQGGEPTLMGLDFFRRAVELQQQHANGKRVTNTFQTNGILIDDEWAAFLAEQGILVGLSIDGPAELHDARRRDKGGRGTFDRVMRGMECLRRHEVEFNTLTCVHRANADHPKEVYRFLRGHGSGYLQFIPVVERAAAAPRADGLTLVRPGDSPEAAVTPWSVLPEQYGRFLMGVFDEWVRKDVGRTFVQLFDVSLEAWMGMSPSLCLFRETCGEAMALEHNGDLYSCDHYVYPENLLGNILETPITALAASEQQQLFGEAKRDALPRCCRECPVLFACAGECPKHRFARTANGEAGLSYLCPAYKKFFKHVDAPMQFMANELRHRRPPANVMEWMRQPKKGSAPGATPWANDPCPCGSRKPYKNCCGRKK